VKAPDRLVRYVVVLCALFLSVLLGKCVQSPPMPTNMSSHAGMVTPTAPAPANASNTSKDKVTSPDSIHLAFLELTSNISDLQSNLAKWRAGDQSAIALAQTNANRIKVVIDRVEWPVAIESNTSKIKDALAILLPALQSRDLASAEPAVQIIRDSSEAITNVFYSTWLASVKESRSAPAATQIVYLDLLFKIREIETLIGKWSKGDQDSPIIARTKTNQLSVLTQQMPSMAMVIVLQVRSLERGLPMLKASLDARNLAASQQALKGVNNSLHDLGHAFYVWAQSAPVDNSPATVQASYFDLARNLTDLRTNVPAWIKGDEASLNLAQENLDNASVLIAHAAWANAIKPSLVKTQSSLTPLIQALALKDKTLAQRSLQPVLDNSNEVTSAYYGNWGVLAGIDSDTQATQSSTLATSLVVRSHTHGVVLPDPPDWLKTWMVGVLLIVNVIVIGVAGFLKSTTAKKRMPKQV